MRRAIASIPATLGALLGVVVIVGIAWALIVPPFQSPDETTHFAYAQSLAERFALPGDPHRHSQSTDQRLAANASYADAVPFEAGVVKPGGWSPQLSHRYLSDYGNHPSRSNGGGPTSALSNPPLYYLYADLAYWAAYSGNAFDRLYAMQLWGVSLLLLTTVGAWLLAGEVLGRRRIPQLVCAGVAGLLPSESFISTSVNPDALLIALWTFALWLGARVVLRRARQRDAVALCAVTAAAIITKGTAYALVPATVTALVLGLLLRPRETRAADLKRLGAATLALVVPVLAWVALAGALSRPAVNGAPGGGKAVNIRQFVSYLWQFYLPRLPFLTKVPEGDGLPLYSLWIRGGWGVFGWLEVRMVEWVYALLAAISVLVLIPAAAIIARFRDRPRLALVTFFAVAVASLLVLLHVTDYLDYLATGQVLLQGRYLLPLVGLFGLAAGLVLTRLPVRFRGPVAGFALAGLLLLQLLALGTVAETYYT
ncbi:MAG: DUF2142 domain-containing protein [Solirubrobacteraceae bacterium]